MKKIFVIGSNSFSGSNFVNRALENGYISVVPVKFDVTAHHHIQQLNFYTVRPLDVIPQ